MLPLLLIDNSFAQLEYYQLTVRLFQAKWRSLLKIFLLLNESSEHP